MLAQDKQKRILNSIDDIKRSTAPDFFYMRLKSKMEKVLNNEKPAFILLRPSLLAACVIFTIIINSVILINWLHTPAIFNQDKTGAAIENFANEYNLSGTGQLYE